MGVLPQHVHLVVLFFWGILIHDGGGVTMDEMITNAAESTGEFALLQDSGQGTPVIKVELDMILTAEQWSDTHPEERVRRHRRKAINGDKYRWPRAEIPYEFSRHDFSARDRREIQSAIDDWQRNTCIKFVRAHHAHRNKIRFINGGGCFSNVGMVGGAQSVGLAFGCRWKSVVTHELGHALGFFHEHTRPDRDGYVSIIRQNIPPQLYYNFQRYPRTSINQFNVPYDYRSIMHYGSKAFSMNGRPTIVTKDSRFQDVIGKRRKLSFQDIKLANIMYQCDARCGQRRKCPGQGFRDKNCRCMCPGDPIQECSSTGTGTGGDTDTDTGTATGTTVKITTGTNVGREECMDQYRQCGHWAQRGDCERSPVHMGAYCKRSCSFCTHEPETGKCEDKKEHCDFWKKEGFCTHSFVEYMQRDCPQSCGYCDTKSSKTDPKDRFYSEDTYDTSDDTNASGLGVTSRPMTYIVVITAVCVLLL